MSYHNPSVTKGARDNHGHYNMRRGALVARGVGMGAVPQLVAPVLGGAGLGSAPKITLPGSPPLTIAQGKALVAAQAQAKLAMLPPLSFRKAQPGDTQIVNEGGKPKVKVSTTSLWGEWNEDLANLFRPFRGIIDALPNPPFPSKLKSDLKNAPLNALFDIFDPIFDHVGAAIDRVLAKKGNTQNFFGHIMNLKRVQAADGNADAATRDLLLRLRTIQAFFALWFTQPIDFAIELGKEGINIVQGAAETAEHIAQQVAQAAGEVAEKILEAGDQAKRAVQSWFGFGGYGGFGAFGLGASGADDAAAALAGEQAAQVGEDAGVVIPPAIEQIIEKVAAAVALALVDKAVETGTGLITGQGSGSGGGSSKTPKPVPTSGPGFTLAPTYSPGVPGSSVAPAPASGGGVSPVVVVGGLALVGLLFLNRR